MIVINTNKILKFFLAVCIMHFSVVCFSQTPGYLGKRFAGGYGLYASPGYIGSGGYTKVNTLHEFFVEYALKKRFMIGFSAKLYRAVSSNSQNTAPDIYKYTGLKQIDSHPTDVTCMKGKNYALYFKLFRKHSLAPWGKYFMVGATLNTWVASYDPDKMYIRTYTNPQFDNTYKYYSDFGATKQNFIKFDLIFGNGRTRMITDRISIDYGYNINVVALTLTVLNYNGEGIAESRGTLALSEYIETTTLTRMRGVTGFNLFCKVGFLIF